jgi:branched-chain amino acid transport system ATP-binding protein
MLRCEGVGARYGHVHVLTDVSLEVRVGELVALIGPNGAGKTTTLKVITALLPPTAGRVTYLGTELTGRNPADVVACGVALVPQGRMIFHSLTVRENLHLGAYRVTDRGTIADREAFVLRVFPALAARLRQAGGTLSGGEQQMLAIGRALMSSPSLLILDEPSTGLAPTMVEAIFRTLLELHGQGTMVLLVEQNAQLALELASRAYVMESGTIVAEGPAADLRRDERLMAAYLG